MFIMATWKGLEPSTSSVTGWHSNQLNYQAAYSIHSSQFTIHDSRFTVHNYSGLSLGSKPEILRFAQNDNMGWDSSVTLEMTFVLIQFCLEWQMKYYPAFIIVHCALWFLHCFYGDPTGIRTRDTAVKGRCLNRLTMEPYISIESILMWLITATFIC